MKTCPHCRSRVASVTVGPFMQVQCIGEKWPYSDGNCGMKWRASEWNSEAWRHFAADVRAKVSA